jgi:hypothetical protein
VRFFYDTEFLERGPGFPLVLISLGVVAEDGRELYLANADFDAAPANAFVREQVLPWLPPAGDPAWKGPAEIAHALRHFVGPEPPEWWGDCAAYDHVVLCQLFGDMEGLPAGWPFFTHDVAQLAEELGHPPLPENPRRSHHALDDARHIRDVWRHLQAKKG